MARADGSPFAQARALSPISRHAHLASHLPLLLDWSGVS
jgi:hypothetical protein